MSGIVLSNAVRQNLSSLQSTAEMLATTQSRLSSGKKVNTALDNPTNYFTAASLDARASDINNLLDGIGNGVQILQAANTGITSLNKLVDSAKSIANQALQTVAGYSTKSNVSTTISGATADDLRGTQSYNNATATGNVIFDGTAGGTTAATSADTLGGALVSIAASAAVTVLGAVDNSSAGSALTVGTATAAATGSNLISELTNGTTVTATGPAAGDAITVNGKTITFTTAGAASKDSYGNYTIGIDQTLNSLLDTIDTMNGNTSLTSAVTAGALELHSGTNSPLTVSDNSGGTVLAKLGLSTSGVTVDTAAATASANISGTTQLFNTHNGLTTNAITDGTTLSVNGKTITFKAADAPLASEMSSGGVLGRIATDGAGNSTIYLGNRSTFTNATVSDVLTAIDLASGVKTASISSGVATISTSTGQTASAVSGGIVTLRSSTGADLNVTAPTDLLKNLGLTTATGSGPLTLTKQRTTSSSTMGTLIADGSTLSINGKTVTFKNAAVPTASSSHQGISGNVETDGSGNSTVYLQGGTINDVLKAVDLATGVRKATLGVSGATVATATGTADSSILASGALKLSTGLNSDLSITGTGNALSALGLTGPSGTDSSFTAARGTAAGSLNGKTLTFTSFKSGSAVNITLGDGTNGTVKTLAQLNTALSANNMSAAIDNASGKLTISTSNDYASHTLGGSDGGAIGGTLASAMVFSTPAAPVADSNAQTTRAGLVKQFNDIMDQITTTAQDASFNGVNLLNGDTLKLVFNETGKSTITIQGVTNNPTGLGLSALTSGTDFIDNNATNAVLTKLSTASTTLRSQASSFGSNLSIVQARQEFSKNLINVLQTGSANLTLADTNEEAANSQALSTRQSIAVSALSLANQSQQGVLQLLR